MPTSPQSPPRRPRLSLQIKAIANGSSGRTSRSVAAHVDVKSPTSFNTLSNAYATAVDRSTPIQEHAPTGLLGGGARRPSLRLQTQPQTQNTMAAKARGMHTPYLGPLLDTPLTAQPLSPAVTLAREVVFPSAMTATPPLSAQPPDNNGAQVFTFDLKNPFSSTNGASKTPITATQVPQQQQKRRTTLPAGTLKLPYTHPRSLRSILRNSPLPPLSTQSPDSPNRRSLRLQEKAARRVAYNSPLEQTITTSKYIKSHVDLLLNDDCETPISPSSSSVTSDDSVLDATMSYSNTRDGGQTPGPFEEMRRRMANMPIALSPTSSGGIRKKARKEKKRRWVWTIGQDEEGNDALPSTPGGLAAAPLPKKLETQTVPVIAVPAPRPRTRGQNAALAAAAAAGVPVLMIPVPPARGGAQPRLPSQMIAPPVQEQRELTPIPSSLAPSLQSSPEPYQHHQFTASSHNQSFSSIAEPPTPSVDSTASNHSLLFEPRGGDVEMSDTSSFMSEEDGYTLASEKICMDFENDAEMDGITPTVGAQWREFTGYHNTQHQGIIG